MGAISDPLLIVFSIVVYGTAVASLLWIYIKVYFPYWIHIKLRRAVIRKYSTHQSVVFLREKDPATAVLGSGWCANGFYWVLCFLSGGLSHFYIDAMRERVENHLDEETEPLEQKRNKKEVVRYWKVDVAVGLTACFLIVAVCGSLIAYCSQ